MNMKGIESLTDIHAHIIYGVDDGARTPKESLKLISMAAEQGIKKIIATPHTMPELTSDEIAEKLNIIKSKVKEENIDCKLYTGQEIFYSEKAIEHLKNGRYLTLADSEYILVEFDPGSSFSYIKMATRDLTFAGFIPIFAHVERYECLKKDDRLDEIRDMGALFQMNYTSLNGGVFNKNTAWCKAKIKEGYISFMATDMHRTDMRKPDTKKALNWLCRYVNDDLSKLICDNANKVIENKQIEWSR